MRLKLRHRFDFRADREVVGAELNSPEGWDGLRTRTGGAFSMPATRPEWEHLLDLSRGPAAGPRSSMRGWTAET
jgi:hypothetical protein